MMSDLIKAYRKIIILTFPPEVSSRPVVCNLTRMFDLSFSLLKAQITPRKEGYITMELSGSEENYLRGINYLKEQGINITSAAQKISRDEDSCIQCGLCTAICPNDSLFIDHKTRKVVFDTERCAACGLCTNVCPVKAMHVEVDT